MILRHKSREFCIESAKILAACGIKTYIFDDLKTTSQLSLAVRYLNVLAGIVITASYNLLNIIGIKLTWKMEYK